jgi:hypothetical protein
MRNHFLLNLTIGFAAACTLLTSDCRAQAQLSWDFPEFKEATAAYRRGDCQVAWDLIWPLAKAGKYEALYFLHATVSDRLIPPGYALLSRTNLSRHKLVLAAYAAVGPTGPKPFQGDPNHRWVRREIPILINELGLGSAGHRVTQCYQSDSSFQVCLNLALSLGVVERLEDYAADVDREARETGRFASCLPHPW